MLVGLACNSLARLAKLSRCNPWRSISCRATRRISSRFSDPHARRLRSEPTGAAAREFISGPSLTGELAVVHHAPLPAADLDSAGAPRARRVLPSGEGQGTGEPSEGV